MARQLQMILKIALLCLAFGIHYTHAFIVDQQAVHATYKLTTTTTQQPTTSTTDFTTQQTTQILTYQTNQLTTQQPIKQTTRQIQCYPEFPCTCHPKYSITCSSRNLTEIPRLPQTNTNRSVGNFDLRLNYITVIHADAFKNFSFIKDIRLDDNHIYMIDDNAFSGVEDSLYLLSLRNNNLTSLSNAFLKLSHLSVLTLEGNPISVLEPTHLSSLGRSLRVFSISLGLFQQWPTQMHYLMNLINLKVTDIPFSYLPLDAFDGFDNSLHILDIKNSSFRRIPSAVCHLLNLQVLTYDKNIKTEHPILEPCRQPLDNVNTVQFIDNNFSIYPDILHTFPNIKNLAVKGNPELKFIDSKIANDSVRDITILDLSMNGFERIPSALRFYQNVQSLNLSHNSIKTLEYGDISPLQRLENLYLNGNPLIYIDDLAFNTQTGVLQIHDMNLENTNLGRIPESVARLIGLKSLQISGRHIECSCSMKYLKHWGNVTVTGQCEFTGESLQGYINGDLQNCY